MAGRRAGRVGEIRPSAAGRRCRRRGPPARRPVEHSNAAVAVLGHRHRSVLTGKPSPIADPPSSHSARGAPTRSPSPAFFFPATSSLAAAVPCWSRAFSTSVTLVRTIASKSHRRFYFPRVAIGLRKCYHAIVEVPADVGTTRKRDSVVTHPWFYLAVTSMWSFVPKRVLHEERSEIVFTSQWGYARLKVMQCKRRHAERPGCTGFTRETHVSRCSGRA